MIEILAEGGVVVLLVAAVVYAATRKRRRMQRHPAPTFVFADLVGYTRLTDERGDEVAARVARSSGARCARSAASTARGRSSRWATA